MKLKRLFCALTAAAVLATSVFSLTANADDSLAYSEEYKSSPFYEKLTLALENSKDKTAMEKTTAEDYLVPHSMDLRVREDRFTHRTETRTRIESDSGSRGGGGGSSFHSGGGFSGRSGKF